MNKHLLIFLFAFSRSLYICAQSQWLPVGSLNIPNDHANQLYTAVAPNGDLYVAYRDPFRVSMGRVMKFNGTSWSDVDTSFSPGDARSITIAFDKAGLPYVAYGNSANDIKANVMKFDGNHWVYVGAPDFTASDATCTSLALDSNDTPYISFRDFTQQGRASVMKFDGTDWIYVGTPGFSSSYGSGGIIYTSLAIDRNNMPMVAFTDMSNDFKATVMGFDGTNWVNVGDTSGVSTWQTGTPSLALDSNGNPYVAYWDRTQNGKATVMKFDGSNWVPLGQPGFTADAVEFTGLVIDKNDVPYIVFRDYANAKKTSVMKFDGTSWVMVGQPGFSDRSCMWPTIAIDKPNGILYASYEECYDCQCPPDCKSVVMKYDIDITTSKKETLNNTGFNIYPNPSNKIITVNIVDIRPKENYLVKITNALGKTIYTETLKDVSGSFTKEIDLSSYSKGIYFVELQPLSANSKSHTREIRKIVLQ